MKTKHTPGPWLFTGIKGVLYIVSEYNPYAFIARVMFTPGLGKQCYKNGQLMAAAPDLLDEHKDWSKLLGNIVIEALQGNYDCLKEVMTELPIIYIDGSPRIESNPIKKAGAE